MPPITTEPAPNPPPVGVARVRIVGTFESAAWGIGYWLSVGDTMTLDDQLALAEAVKASWDTRILVDLHTDLVSSEILLRYFDGSSDPEVSFTNAVAGSHSGNHLSSGSAAVLSWHILDTYRGGHPRTYLCGIATEDVTDSRLLTNEFVSDLNTGAAQFLSDVNALTFTSAPSIVLGTLANFRAGVALAPPQFKAYFAVAAQRRICSQRRRLGPEVF